jgi:hypothetical protein
MVMKKQWIVSTFTLVLFLFGCAGENDEIKDSQLSLLKTTNPPPLELNKEKETVASQVKKEVQQMKELYDVAVIVGEEDILVAYKVRHLYRIRMKKIEMNLKKTLEKKFPGENFSVSSDYKVFLEAVRLKEKLDEGKISKKEANKKLKKLIKLKDKQT